LTKVTNIAPPAKQAAATHANSLRVGTFHIARPAHPSHGLPPARAIRAESLVIGHDHGGHPADHAEDRREERALVLEQQGDAHQEAWRRPPRANKVGRPQRIARTIGKAA
jgi:hypothetical protein